MSLILLPQQLTSLPQRRARLASAYQQAEFFSLMNMGGGTDIARGNNFVPTAGVAFPTKVIREQGGSLHFDGTRSMDTGRGPVFSSQFTIVTWVRPTALNTGYIRILETAYNTGIYVGSNSGSQYGFIVNNSALEGCVGGQQVVGKRDFLCAIFDMGVTKLYVNGTLVATGTATTPTSGPFMRAGFSNAGGTFAWTGDIDTVGIFNRAFTEKEIQLLNDNPASFFVAEPRRLYASSASFNTYTITPSGGVVFAGTAPTAKQKFYVITPSGGITFSGTNGIIGTRTFTISPTGGVTFGGTGSMTSSNAQTYIITPIGGVTFSGSATIVKTNIVLPTGGIVFSGSAPITSNTVISTVTTRLPLTGVGS